MFASKEYYETSCVESLFLRGPTFIGGDNKGPYLIHENGCAIDENVTRGNEGRRSLQILFLQ